jgi:hypothetical protein
MTLMLAVFLIEVFPQIAGRGWFLSPHLFANAVGGRLPMPLAIIFAPEALTRPKAGQTQAGLSRSQRQRNLEGAFAMPQDQHHHIANRSMLLIDKVMTTGATLYGAAKTLHRAVSGPVSGLVLARVLRHGLQPLLSGTDFSIERYDRRRVLQYAMAVF